MLINSNKTGVLIVEQFKFYPGINEISPTVKVKGKDVDVAKLPAIEKYVKAGVIEIISLTKEQESLSFGDIVSEYSADDAVDLVEKTLDRDLLEEVEDDKRKSVKKAVKEQLNKLRA